MRTEAVKYKSLYAFYGAALSLLFCGILLSNNSLLQGIILLLCCISGVFAIYRLNDFIDSEWNLRNNLRFFFKEQLHVLFILLFGLVIVPLAIIFLPTETFVLLGISGFVGSLYSLKFRFNGYVFRIKNTFILKNICIGLIWGGLVLIGAGGVKNNLAIPVFIFAFAQVFIGSVIRDLPDIVKDVQNGVKTFPNVLGEKSTVVILSIVNVFSILAFRLEYMETHGLVVCVPVIMWRSLDLYQLYRQPKSNFWGQTGNLLTCFFIFLMLAISLRIYEH